MKRGAWWAIDHRIAELDITEMTECVCASTRARVHTHTQGKLGMGTLGKRVFLSYREVSRQEGTLNGEMG